MQNLNIKNLHICVDKKNLISNLNLEVNEKEMVAIIGKSGVGKTTLIESLISKRNIKKGDIYYNYQKITRRNIRSFQQKISYLTQQKILIDNLTILENIKIFLSNNNKGFKKFFNIITNKQKNEILNDLKKIKFEKSLFENLSNLSSGEYQRLQCALLMSKNPRVVFADEPTSNLDKNNSKILIEWIRSYIKTTSAIGIIVLHDLNLVKYFDKVILIKEDGYLEFEENKNH